MGTSFYPLFLQPAWSTCDAENSASVFQLLNWISDRVLGKIEKNSFIALPGRKGHSGLLSSEAVYLILGGFGEEFFLQWFKGCIADTVRCMQGLLSSNPVSGDLLMSFSGSFNLAPGGLLWNEECWHLPFIGGFSFWGTRTLPQSCAVSWLLRPCLCIPSLPWLVTVWTCPLDSGKVLEVGVCSLHTRNRGQKSLRVQGPHAVLLSFTWPWSVQNWPGTQWWWSHVVWPEDPRCLKRNRATGDCYIIILKQEKVLQKCMRACMLSRFSCVQLLWPHGP